MKKQLLFVLFGAVMVTWACTSGNRTSTTQPPVDEGGTAIAATTQAPTTRPGENNVPFVIPDGLASGADTQVVPAVGPGGAPWEVGPAHSKFTLTGYTLQNKFHEPSIFVYPAEEFAQANPGAQEQLERLRSALAGSPLLLETLPTVPFFNAGHLIAANIQLIKFQNGSGVRELTQYAQYPASINNHELFYHFQGLTDDGQFYVIAILPIIAPILAEDDNPGAPVPTEGVPIPTDIGPNTVYYISVTEKLNSLAPDLFTPSLGALDALIQSILVTNP